MIHVQSIPSMKTMTSNEAHLFFHLIKSLRAQISASQDLLESIGKIDAQGEEMAEKQLAVLEISKIVQSRIDELNRHLDGR